MQMVGMNLPKVGTYAWYFISSTASVRQRDGFDMSMRRLSIQNSVLHCQFREDPLYRMCRTNYALNACKSPFVIQTESLLFLRWPETYRVFFVTIAVSENIVFIISELIAVCVRIVIISKIDLVISEQCSRRCMLMRIIGEFARS